MPIAFPRQQWLLERAAMLDYTYVPYLSWIIQPKLNQSSLYACAWRSGVEARRILNLGIKIDGGDWLVLRPDRLNPGKGPLLPID
jgi:hypothetical protein